MKIVPSAALAVSLFATVVPAQVLGASGNVPSDVLRRLSIRAGEVQSVVVPQAPTSAVRFGITLAGKLAVIELRPFDVRTPDFKLLVDDGQSIRQLPTPAAVTYRGEIVGDAGSVVAATIVNGQLTAMVHGAAGKFGVQPLRDALPGAPTIQHVLYRESDVIMPQNAGCSLLDPHHGGQPVQGGKQSTAMNKVAELGIDVDNAYYNRYGRNTTSVTNQVTRVMNSVDAIYRRDVAIQYKITTILVRTSRVYSSTDIRGLLSEFRSRWNSQHGGIVRDVAHIFTGVGSFSGVIGIAYLGVVCNRSVAYGASKAFSGNASANVGLVAHEIGHNWNAGHCNSSPPCNIMCSGLGGCNRNITSFGNASKNAITAFRNSRSCLSDPQPTLPPVLSTMNPTSVKAFPGQRVSVTGLRLDSVTGITVGGTAVTNYSATSPTQAAFTLPNDFNIANNQPVIARNATGPSNALQLTVTGNHPSILSLPNLLPRNITLPLRTHTDRAWSSIFLVSTQNQPSALAGVVSLNIGNNFTDLFQIAAVTATNGGLAELPIRIPASFPAPSVLYWQCVTVDPNNITTPFEVSNSGATTIF